MPEDFKVQDPNPVVTPTVEVEDKEYNLNDKGDALNEDGTVFKTKDELVDLNKPIIKDPEEKKEEVIEEKIEEKKEEVIEEEPEEIKIDDVTYKVDKEGNAVDDKGTIVHTKMSIDKMEEEGKDVEQDLDKIIELTGISIEDEEGKLIEYEKGDKGTANYITDVYNKGANDHAQDAVNQLYETYPIVRKIIRHLDLNNGEIEGFNQTVDYSEVELEKTNEKQLELVNLQYFLSRGHSQEEAERFVTYSKNDKKLYDDAVKHLDLLKTEQDQHDKRQDQLVAEGEQQRVDSDNKYKGFIVEKGKIVDLKQKGSVYDKIVNDGQIRVNDSVLEIPKTLRIKIDNGKIKTIDREQLINYAFVPKVQLVDGQKYMDTDYNLYLYNQRNNRTVDNDILDLINAITGNDISQLVEQKVKSDKVKEVRSLKSKSKKSQKKLEVAEEKKGGAVKMPWEK